MKAFIIRSLYIISIGFIGYLLTIFIYPEFKKPSCGIPVGHKYYFDSCKIIICGDSRADRQVDPAVINKATNLTTINIATSSWDLYSVSKAISSIELNSKILIISASFFQVNDGAIDNGYFSNEAFADMTLKERISLYGFRVKDLFDMQSVLFNRRLNGNCEMDSVGNDKRRPNIDFSEQLCHSFTIDESWFKRHPWYKSADITGIKRELMAKALKRLSLLKNCKILIYNGPVSEDFTRIGNNIGVIQLENQYNAFMKNECSKYSNIVYHSFLNDTGFLQKNFYDPQHLCGSGAFIFSNEIVDLLKQYRFIEEKL